MGVLLNLIKAGLLLQELVLGEVGELVDVLEPVGLPVEILLVLLLHLRLGILQGLLPLGLLLGVGDLVHAELGLKLILTQAVVKVVVLLRLRSVLFFGSGDASQAEREKSEEDENLHP